MYRADFSRGSNSIISKKCEKAYLIPNLVLWKVSDSYDIYSFVFREKAQGKG